MVYKTTIRVSVPNLKSMENFLLCYMGKWARGGGGGGRKETFAFAMREALSGAGHSDGFPLPCGKNGVSTKTK